MLDGIRKLDEIEYSLGVVVSGSNPFMPPGVVAGQAFLQTYFTPNFLMTSLGIELFTSASFGDVNERRYELSASGITGRITRTRAGFGATSHKLRLINVTLVTMPSGVWRLKIGTVEWVVEGTVEFTATGVVLTSGMQPSPAAIPLIGIPPRISAVSSIDPVLIAGYPLPPGTPPGSGVVVQEHRAVATGGYRWRIGATWYAAPLELPTQIAGYGELSGADTSSVTVEKWVRSTVDDGNLTNKEESRFSTCWLWGALPKEYIRMNAPFRELIARFGMPENKRRKTDITETNNYFGTNPGGSSSIVDTVVLAAQTQFLETVGDAPGTAESILIESLTPPYSWGKGVINGAVDYVESINDSETYEGLLTPSGQEVGAMTHADWFPYLLNTWWHPQFSIFPWFSPDTASSSVRWDLLGSDSARDYWTTLRQQHITHPALPSGQNLLTRASIVADPITQNAITGVVDSFVGLPTFWGAREFTTTPLSGMPTSRTTNSTSATRFLFWDGTSPGSGSVSGTGATLNTGDAIEFEMTSFSAHPYGFPKRCDRVVIDWNDPNIASIEVFSVGQDGSKESFATVPGTYRLPRGQSTKWASSIGHDFGAGFLVDEYNAIETNDETAGTVASERRSATFDYLTGVGPRRLRFEITRVNPADPVSIKHIQFLAAPASDALVVHECGRFASILFKDGPFLRTGVQTYYNYLLDTPVSTPFANPSVGNAQMLGDLWAFENVYGQGVDAQTGLLARMNATFENGEEFTIVDHLWRDPDGQLTTLGFVCQGASGPVFAGYNSYRQMPPLLMFPDGKRTKASDWVPDLTNQGQFMYVLAFDRHPIIYPDNKPAALIGPSGDVLSHITAPTGWKVGTYAVAVNNNEGYNHTFRFGSVDYFAMRPWRGCISLPHRFQELLLAGIKMTRDEQLGFLHLVVPTPSGVSLHSWNERQGTTRTRAVTADASANAGIAWSKEQRQLVVVYDFDNAGTNEVKYTETFNQGLTWSTATMLWEGKGASNAFDHFGREYIAYWHDGAFRVRVRKASAQAWSGPYTVVASADEGTTAIEVSPDASAPVVVVVNVLGASPEIRRFESVSGGLRWDETT